MFIHKACFLFDGKTPDDQGFRCFLTIPVFPIIRGIKYCLWKHTSTASFCTSILTSAKEKNASYDPEYSQCTQMIGDVHIIMFS